MSVATFLRRLLPSRNGHVTPIAPTKTRAESILDQSAEYFQEAQLREVRRSEEKLRVRAGYGGAEIAGKKWFLPYLDSTTNLTSETEAMRSAYRGMLRSPYIKSPLYYKCFSIASLDWQIQSDRQDSPRDIECGEFLRHCIERLCGGMPELAINLTLPKLIEGYQVAEPILEVERTEAKWRGKAVYKEIKSKHPDLYNLQVDEFDNVVGIQGRGPNKADEYYPINEFIYSKYMSVYSSPYGMSDLRAAYSPYWMLDTVTKLRAIHAEKYTTPFLKGTYVTTDQKSSLESALAAAKANTWIAIPEGAMIEAVSIAAAGESDYKSFCDDSKKDMLVSIIGAYLQVLEGQVADGRGSADVSSKDVTSLFLWMLASQFQEVINKQFFPTLINLNYAGVGKFRLVLGGVSEQEVSSIVGNLQGMQALGYPLSKADVARRTSYAQPKDDADKLAPPQPAAQPSPFGGQALPFSEQKPPAPVIVVEQPKPTPVVVAPVVTPFSEERPRSSAARRARRRAHGLPVAEKQPVEVAPDPRIDMLSEKLDELARQRVTHRKIERDDDGRIAGITETVE